MMAYFAIGMGLYSEGSYEEVMSQVADGLSWVSGRQESLTPPSKSVSDSVLNKRNRRITLVVENRDHSATQTNLVIGVTSG
jgi:Insertion element 4 transposase N-terminal